MKTDILIVGCGVAGLYCALNLPSNKKITVITKSNAESSDSFLAQGGICVQRDDGDYDAFYEDTMRAGHYENKPESVDIMIKASRGVINDLISYGVEFEKRDGELAYTKEGAHSKPRILFKEDQTGKEITSKLLQRVKALPNVMLIEHFTMVDIIADNNECFGIIGHDQNGEYSAIEAEYTVLCAGIRDSVSVFDEHFAYPILLVVGGEKRGISRALLDAADHIVRIDYGRKFDGSLSAASAATVMAFEIFRQNRK